MPTAADNLCERLLAWGVTTIYGYPGDGIDGFLGALQRRQDTLRLIQVRHEETAAFLACAHAKYTGEVGVCTATSGPGAIHLLNGLFDAKLDHVPVVAIVGQTYARAMGGDFQQEVDLLSLYEPVAGAYRQQVNLPSMVNHIVDRAFRIASAERTVTAVIFPADVQDMDAAEQPWATHTIHTAPGWSAPKVVPHDEDLKRAADVLNAGERVAMVVGQGALNATDEVIAVADTLGAGVAKALLGKAAIPDDVPFCTNTLGLLGTKPSWDMMQDADTLLMVGTSFPYSEFLPPGGKARGVQIDLLGRQLSIRYPMEVPLCGDSKDTLTALLPLLTRKTDRSWQDGIAAAMRDWWKLMDDQEEPVDTPRGMRPQRIFAAVSEALPDNALIAADSGSCANWYARHVRIRRGMKAMLSGNLATMIPGMPYALAAKFAYPDRLAVGFVGDGAMQMLGINELITVAKYWQEWKDPRLVYVVMVNKDLNQVTWEQRVLEGNAKFDASQDIPYFPFADFARMVGLEGIKLERSADCEQAVRAAFAADRPVVIEAHTDPEEPPLPPHITLQQAKRFASSFRADPSQGLPGAVNALREKIDEFVPGR